MSAIETQIADTLPHLSLAAHQFHAAESTRQRVTRWLVIGYLVVLSLSLTPLIVFLIAHHEGLTVADVTTLTAVTTGAVSSLTGLLGFVLGYYFKSSESVPEGSSSSEAKPRARSPRTSTR